MEKCMCKCEKSNVIFDPCGEDLWRVSLDNCSVIKNKHHGEEKYKCNNCGEIITTADSFMVIH